MNFDDLVTRLTKANVRDRFDARWTPEPFSGCHIWIAALKEGRYGAFRLSTIMRAHRVAWLIHYGTIPGNLSVLHHCDTPLCVNPTHLFLGTQANNNQDAISKGRNWQKLTAPQVLAIRRRHASGERQFQLAKEFGVCAKTIRVITKKQSWKHVL